MYKPRLDPGSGQKKTVLKKIWSLGEIKIWTKYYILL